VFPALDQSKLPEVIDHSLQLLDFWSVEGKIPKPERTLVKRRESFLKRLASVDNNFIVFFRQTLFGTREGQNAGMNSSVGNGVPG